MKKPVKKPKKKKLKWHFDRAWKQFSIYIRIRDKCTCFTCGKVDKFSKMQAGHFKHNRLDFNEININCQGISCNHFKSGRLDVYAEKLEAKYGPGIIQQLTREAHEIKKYTREELDGIYQYYKNFNENNSHNN